MIGITIAIVMTGTITTGMIRTITIGTICTIGTNEFFPSRYEESRGHKCILPPVECEKWPALPAFVMSTKFSNPYRTRLFLMQAVRRTSHRKVKPGDIVLIVLLEGENGNCETCFLCQFSL